MNLLERLVVDLRRALRSLIRRPAFALTAVATLAIGIGATTAMFAVTWGVALRPLPFMHHERLFSVCTRSAAMPREYCSLSPPNSLDLKRLAHGIEYLGIARRWDAKLRSGDEVETLSTAVLTPDVFRALGVRAERGRLLDESDLIGRPSAVALISDGFWRTRFAAQNVLGRALSLDGEAVTIVGVLPPGLEIPELKHVDIWRPLPLDPRDEANRGWAGFSSFGLAREGWTIERLSRDLAQAAPALRADHFSGVEGWGLETQSLTDLVLGRSRHLLLIFLGAVALLLLVACANVANLMLEQAAARRREWGIRLALGSSASRIAALQLTESLLLATLGAIAGLGVAALVVRVLKHLAPAGLPRLEQLGVDATVLGFAIGVAALTAGLFGLWPAIRAAAVELAELLRAGGRSSTAVRSRLSGLLVTAQIALAMTLVVGAGLLSRSFQRMAAWNPGFDPSQLLTFSVLASREQYTNHQRIVALWTAIEDQVRSVPGVQAVASASAGPLFGGGDGASDFRIDGVDRPRPAFWFNVGPGFFAAMGIPVVRGREFDAQDGDGRPLVAVVNEAFVRRYWPGSDPLGKRIAREDGSGALTVVGVVRDVASFTPGTPVKEQLYFAMQQEPRGFVYLVLRTAADPATLASAVQAAIRRVDRDLHASNYRTIREIEREELRRPLFNALLLSTFALTALLLAGIGTYALLAYHVRRRLRELGIRLALGARPRDVGALVIRDGLWLTLPGLALGALGGRLAGQVAASLAPGVSASDPVSLLLAAAAILLVAALAFALPARRAATVAPAITLQSDE